MKNKKIDINKEVQSVYLSDNACSTPTLPEQGAVICDANEIDLNDNLGEEMRSDNIVNENLVQLPTEHSWIMACQISCLSCRSENLVKITDIELACSECGEQQCAAKPCCSDITSRERFSVKINERNADCSDCHSEMIIDQATMLHVATNSNLKCKSPKIYVLCSVFQIFCYLFV